MRTHKDGDMRIVRAAVACYRENEEYHVGDGDYVTLRAGDIIVSTVVFCDPSKVKGKGAHWKRAEFLRIERKGPPLSAWERFKALFRRKPVLPEAVVKKLPEAPSNYRVRSQRVIYRSEAPSEHRENGVGHTTARVY